MQQHDHNRYFPFCLDKIEGKSFLNLWMELFETTYQNIQSFSAKMHKISYPKWPISKSCQRQRDMSPK